MRLSRDFRKVDVDGTTVELTPREFDLLELLLMYTNVALTNQAVLSHLYGGIDEPSPQIVDVLICKLRRKLAHAGASAVIHTIPDRGYTIPGAEKESGKCCPSTFLSPVPDLMAGAVANVVEKA